MTKIDPARAAKLLTTEKGCRVLDAAVAPLAGWVYDHIDYGSHTDGERLTSQAKCWQMRVPGTLRAKRTMSQPPPFCTAGDGDPYARWDLVAAMWKALPHEEGQRYGIHEAGWGDPPGWHVFMADDRGRGMNSRRFARGHTPHRAFVLALAAAGLLEVSDEA